MRSKCRSLLLSVSLLSAISVLEIGAGSRFSFLLLTPVQAKGASDSTAAVDGESQDGTGAKCSSAVGAVPGGRPHHFHGGFPAEGGLGHMSLDFSSLNLSEDQKSKIKAIRGRNAGYAKDLRQSLMTKAGEFRDLIFSETATNDQVTAKRDELKPLKDELENLRLSDFLAIRAVFTAEQRKKWAESKPPERKPHARGGGPGGQVDGEADKADKKAGTANSTTVNVK
jgi:Spy/CpxP family protein refolding chaperone